MPDRSDPGRQPVGRASEAVDSPELRRLRRRIDAIDHQLVALMSERARLAIAAGRAKADAGRHAIRDPRREAEVIANVADANTGPLEDADLRAIWRRLMRATRELEAQDRDREHRDG